jgi:HSP20 family protein
MKTSFTTKHLNPKTMRRNHRHNNLGDFLEEFFNTGEDLGLRHWGRFPAANIRETDAAYLIDLVVPGRSKEDIKIHIEKDSLTVSSEVKSENGTEFRRREFHLAPFKRTFRLPETADRDNITASYDQGILTVSVAKKEQAKVQREITIS